MLTVLLLCFLDSILEANKHLGADSTKYFPSLIALLQLPWAVAAGPVCSRPEPLGFFLRAGHLHPFFSSWDFFLSSPVGINAGFPVFSRLPQVICSHAAFTRVSALGWYATPAPRSAVGKWPLPDWKTTARAGLSV